MTITPDPVLERVRDALLEIAQNDQALLAKVIDDVMAKRGEVVIEEVVEILSESDKVKEQAPELAELLSRWVKSQKMKSALARCGAAALAE